MSESSGREPGKGLGGAAVAVLDFLEKHLSAFVPDIVKRWASKPTIVEDVRRSRPWHLAKQADGRYLLQIDHEWLVTNNSDAAILIIRAEVNRPEAQGFLVIEGPDGFVGDYPVPPKSTVRMTTHFMIPTTRRHWHTSKWFNFTFTDHTGYKIRKQRIEAKPPRRARKTTPLEMEALLSIADEDERAVAAILKDELTRYTQNGRQQGGLGSVRAQVANQRRDNIYQDSWSSGRRGEQQDIVIGDSRLVSENGDALLARYNGVSGDRQARIVQALLDRISRDREYYGVSYLTAYVMWRVGKLREALETMTKRYEYRPSIVDRVLRRSYVNRVLEKTQQFGYSDVFGFLNGLLRFEHASLSEDDLKAIERFVSGTSESTFQIRQKLASATAHRVAAG